MDGLITKENGKRGQGIDDGMENEVGERMIGEKKKSECKKRLQKYVHEEKETKKGYCR